MKAAVLICLAFLVTVSAKICYQTCPTGSKYLKSIDIEGCRRRRMSTSNGQLKFKCGEELKGPPCIVKRGDTVHLNIDFVPEYPIKDLVQSAFWMAAINIPWVGLDTAGCKYLTNNQCNLTSVVDPVTSQITPQTFNYPIEILQFYPAGYYKLKWDFTSLKPDGQREEIACVNFAIKIL